MHFPLFLLDSGDPDEFREIAKLAKDNGSELWSATTNPSLIAKKLAGKKVSMQEAFRLQKEIVLEILSIVPGLVSAEVYAAKDTTAEEMISQGKEIATWHKRIIVKLPTNVEGFKARSELRKTGIPINNTLVFSQEQIFAICLQEQILQKQYGPINNEYPMFISPFVGRLDDIGLDGMQLVEYGMDITKSFKNQNIDLWMLAASIRRLEHVQRSITCGSELITVPAKVLREWFGRPDKNASIEDRKYAENLTPIPQWNPSQELFGIKTEDTFFEAISSGKLNIKHDLTDKGIDRFVQDWSTIIAY